MIIVYHESWGIISGLLYPSIHKKFRLFLVDYMGGGVFPNDYNIT